MLNQDVQVLLYLIPALLFSAWAAWRVRVNYAEGEKVQARCGLTGAEAAQRVLQQAGVIASIEETPGKLSDHYDPRSKTLRLSKAVYEGQSLAALGVACHEAGHAVQDGMNFAFLGLRNLIVPLASVGSNIGLGLIVAGLGLSAAECPLGRWIVMAGIGAFSLTVLFQLINLPVEFDATRRGRENLIQAGLVGEDEDKILGKVLEAAAMTYVAATVTSAAQMAYLIYQAMNPKKQTRKRQTRKRR